MTKAWERVTQSLDFAQYFNKKKSSLLPVQKMPTVAVDKADLWERLGKEYSQLPSL